MRHSLDTKLVQDILTYLASRPYAEVSGLITKIQMDAKAIPAEAESVSENKDQAVS